MSLTPEERLEIAELVARYDQATDDGRPEDWAATWTDDGCWDGGITVQGKEELLAFARGLPTNPAFAAFRGARHFGTNFTVEETGPGEARLVCDNLMLQPLAEGGVFAITLADYDDRLRKVDGRWLFVFRKWRPVKLPRPAGS